MERKRQAFLLALPTVLALFVFFLCDCMIVMDSFV